MYVYVQCSYTLAYVRFNRPQFASFMKPTDMVGAKEHPVYGGGRYLMNIYFLKYCCLAKTG